MYKWHQGIITDDQLLQMSSQHLDTVDQEDLGSLGSALVTAATNLDAQNKHNGLAKESLQKFSAVCLQALWE